MPAFTPPPDYTRIRVVKSFAELVSTPFRDGVNALCWERTLAGDFGEIVERLGSDDGMTSLDAARLGALHLSPAGQIAADVMSNDLRLLGDLGLSPVLDCIRNYPCDEDAGPVRTDVYSWHVDSATVEADTWLCTYFGATSEALRNDEALRRTDIAETRAELLAIFGGEDDDAFAEFLRENCYDLHYAAAPHARPISFGIGNLWRIATEWPGSPVPPCIHRAPETQPNDPLRLLLIS